MSECETARHDELALLEGCLDGDRAALARFEREFAGALQLSAARVRAAPDFVADVVQTLRVELFTGDKPRARTFSGRGPLHAWLKVVTTRAALDRLRSETRAVRRANELTLTGSESTTGLDSQLDRQRHGEHFAAALRGALDQLSARQRNVLRLRFVSDLNIDAIGRAYGVHRATVARWIASAVSSIGRTLRTQLHREEHMKSPSELENTLRALDSQLTGALASFLAASSIADEAL